MEAPRSTQELFAIIDRSEPVDLVRILMHFDPWFVGQVGRPAKRVEEVLLHSHIRRVLKLRA